MPRALRFPTLIPDSRRVRVSQGQRRRRRPRSAAGLIPTLSPRSYARFTQATSWEEIWEAGNYYERVSELLEDAGEWIALIGWQIDSRLPMKRPLRGEELNTDPMARAPWEPLKQKLIRLCEARPDLQIYILMWDHAYFYVLEREAWQGRIWEDVHPRIHFVFDNRHPLGASHHEKIVLVDGKVALCGGIDLCDERWDTPSHAHVDPRRSLSRRHEHHGPYHDLAVQVGGPICDALHRHVARRWRRISTIPFPQPPRRRHRWMESKAAGHPVYFSRTLARIDFEPGKSHVTREIEFLYRELVQKARHRLIMEGQYYWSEEFNDLLIAKIHEMRGTDFEIVLILADLRKVKSLTRIMTNYELRLLERLSHAAEYAGVKLVLGNPYSYPPEPASVPRSMSESADADAQPASASAARPVYVHSKVLIVDDRYLAIGSANFAARALRLDSEVNLTLEGRTDADRLHIRRFADQLLEHWSIHPERPNPHRSVALRHLNAGSLRSDRRGFGRLLSPPEPDYTWISWNWIFDPSMSWLYPLKRRWSKLAGTRSPMGAFVTPGALVLMMALATLASVGLSGALSFRSTALHWSWIYGALMSSCFLLPLPFLAVAVFATLHLSEYDSDLGVRLAVASFWSVSLWGYLGARIFPTAADRFFRKTGAREWEAHFGIRRFPSLLTVVFDPRLSLRTKVAYEGLYTIPVPWFALIHGLLLSSALYWALSCLSWAWIAFAPQRMIQIVSQLAVPFLGAILITTWATLARRENR